MGYSAVLVNRLSMLIIVYWAKDLPTWRRKLNFGALFDKELTGYHLYSWLTWILFPHFAIIFGNWSWGKEFLLLSFLFFFFSIEDFLWFVFNPKFGIK